MHRVWHTLAVIVLMAVGPISAGEPIHAYYFDGEGCHGCEEGKAVLDNVIRLDPDVALTVLDSNDPSDFELAHALLTVAGIGPEELPSSPALLMGDTYISGTGFTEEAVVAALDLRRATGAPSMMERAERIRGHAKESLPSRFRRFGVLTVIVAGLIDGVNPCAFATLVFFIAYLSFAGARGGSILRVGLVFALGVFVAYFAFGVGILHAVLALEGFPMARRIVHGVLAVACVVLAVLSLQDWHAARSGRLGDIKLQLPGLLKRQTHKAVRGGVQSRMLLPAAFVAGATVSALEFACTGQVYIPAITYMVSMSEARGTALLWLALYDTMFIVPLLALLGFAYSGASSKAIAQFAEEKLASTKAALAVLFLLSALFFGLKASAML